MRQKLGQHFLTSKKIAKTLIDAVNIEEGDYILEIGPGKGFLTSSLLKENITLVCVEKDSELIDHLKNKFQEEIKTKKLILINEDVREVPWVSVIKTKPFKVVSNIPYYLTGSIIRLLLEEKNQPKCISLLMQKEVAERIAKDKKESILSLSVKFFGEAKYIRTVPTKFFNPEPKVASAIILIKNLVKRTDKEKGVFFEVINKAFSQKRKTLKNNLKDYPSVLNALKDLGVDEKERAEDVDFDRWRKVASEGTEEIP